MDKEIVSIIWHNMNVGQMLYIQAVVVPEFNAVLAKHIESIKEIGEIEK